MKNVVFHKLPFTESTLKKMEWEAGTDPRYTSATATRMSDLIENIPSRGFGPFSAFTPLIPDSPSAGPDATLSLRVLALEKGREPKRGMRFEADGAVEKTLTPKGESRDETALS